MASLDDRSVLNAHLFATAFVIVVCGMWVAAIPEGSLNFVYDETGKGLWLGVARVLVYGRGFGLVVGALFLILVIIARRKGWYERKQIKLCWVTLAIELSWFSCCIYFLWPAMRVVFRASSDIFIAAK